MKQNTPVVVAKTKRKALGYHEFSENPSSDVYEITQAAFSSQIQIAKDAAQRNNTRIEVTFDDLHRSQLTSALPVLEQHGVKGLFFTPAAWVGVRRETATWKELRDLVATGHRIGSHGNTHALLTQCSPQDLMSELVDSRRRLEDELSVAVTTISMPGGRWNEFVCEACIEAGYEAIYISQPVLGPRSIPSFLRDRIDVVSRLVVRRTMTDQMVADYVTGRRSTSAKLYAEYAMKQLLKDTFGEARYQAMWTAVFRSPSEMT